MSRMNIERNFPSSTQSKALLSKLNQIHGPCIACSTCDGLCQALIDTLMVPDIVARDKRAIAADQSFLTRG